MAALARTGIVPMWTMATACGSVVLMQGALRFLGWRLMPGAFLSLFCLGALVACTEPSAVSQPDAATPAEEANTTARQFPASVPSRSPEPVVDLPLPRLMPTAPMPRIYNLRRGSKNYDFRLEVEPVSPRNSSEDVGPPGELTIFNKGTTRVAQRIRIGALAESASYADYEPEVLVDDFDFDGHEDFALHTADHLGPYGTAAYSVFLFVSASQTFVHSPALSRLTEESLAPMRGDANRKRLVIASKSGCCIHWFEEYEVHRGVPRLMKRETEEVGADERCVLKVETRDRCGMQPASCSIGPPFRDCLVWAGAGGRRLCRRQAQGVSEPGACCGLACKPGSA